MFKNKKFVVILTVFMLGATLLVGCNTPEEGKTVPEDKTTNQAVEDKTAKDKTTDQAVEDKTTKDKTTDQTEAQSQTTANGTLKAVDATAGTVTITTEKGDELVLKVTNKSKFLVGGSSSTLAQLADKKGSGVSVEYLAESKTVTSVSIH